MAVKPSSIETMTWDASNNLDVNLITAIPTGANTIGNVGLVAGAATIGNVGLVAGVASVGTVGLNTGTNTIGAITAATTTVDLTATSPASATTTAQTPTTGLGLYRSMFIYASIQGATGGVLDIYLQVSPDGGTTWVDYAHFPQVAAGAGAITRVWTVAKASQQTTLTTVGTGVSPALAASTIVGGDWGDRIRVVFVAGASTSAGASQTIKLILTS